MGSSDRGDAGWRVELYPSAGEAGGSFRYSLSAGRSPGGSGGDPDRSKSEAARRARGKLRRYCAGNGLNRLGTLTYAREGCHDPRAFRRDMGSFFRSLRRALGGDRFAYAWVPEWHKSGHGLHAHFAVGRYVARGAIESAWGHGFVHIKLLSDLPVGTTARGEARVAGRYLAKYVGKDFGDRPEGLHRYEVAQGFQPETVPIEGRSVDHVLALASDHMGARPEYVWQSRDQEDWQLPPAVWASWR